MRDPTLSYQPCCAAQLRGPGEAAKRHFNQGIGQWGQGSLPCWLAPAPVPPALRHLLVSVNIAMSLARPVLPLYSSQSRAGKPRAKRTGELAGAVSRFRRMLGHPLWSGPLTSREPIDGACSIRAVRSQPTTVLGAVRPYHCGMVKASWGTGNRTRQSKESPCRDSFGIFSLLVNHGKSCSVLFQAIESPRHPPLAVQVSM